QNQKADALTRRSGDRPKEGDSRGRPIAAILHDEDFLQFDIESDVLPKKFSISAASLTTFKAPQVPEPFLSDIRTVLETDNLAKEIITALQNGDIRHPKVPLSECQYSGNLLLVHGLVYIPNDLDLQRRLLQNIHDHPAAGHPGTAATYEMVTRNYWWPSMRKTIARFVRNCDTCARVKPVRHSPYGYLKPLEVPQPRWDSI